MKEPPRKKDEPLLNYEIKILIATISIASGVLALVAFIYIHNITGDFKHASTIAFTILAVDSLIYVFSIRSLRHSLWQKDIFSNRYLVIAVILGFILQLVAIYHPFMQKVLQTVSLNLTDWSLIFFVCAIEVIVIEWIKSLFLLKRKAY